MFINGSQSTHTELAFHLLKTKLNAENPIKQLQLNFHCRHYKQLQCFLTTVISTVVFRSCYSHHFCFVSVLCALADTFQISKFTTALPGHLDDYDTNHCSSYEPVCYLMCWKSCEVPLQDCCLLFHAIVLISVCYEIAISQAFMKFISFPDNSLIAYDKLSLK